MKEQEIYKRVLQTVIEQSEKLQINNSDEVIRKLIRELERYELPRLKSNDI